MTVYDFITQYFDQSNVGDTPENLGQCVGLIEKYLDILNLNDPHLYGNAKDLLANADPNKFDVIQNTPDNIPSQGDVFVFGDTYGGGFGHTGIVVWASVFLVCLFEQNDGLHNGTPQLKTYLYDGALGWLSPKVAQGTPVTVSVTTSSGETNVPITVSSTVGTSSAMTPDPMTNTTLPSQTTTSGGLIKPPLPIGQRIVFELQQIERTLFVFLKNLLSKGVRS